ncbi:MAG TPA: M14 family zinc carboxypeptidase [Gammaproteobacteria bacterium]|nr:M14 family zinc carboxypeptidase [Gammaproteobacteria bacterium]
MRLRAAEYFCFICAAYCSLGPALADEVYTRDPNQPVDQAYTQKIKDYTTDPSFNSPLTDYLPASAGVPTPATVLGDVAGAPNVLPPSKQVYAYFRLLAEKSPRVKVFTIGKTEEGRDMIAVAVADESLLAGLDANTARLAKLADPRSIDLDDGAATQLVSQSTPVYYITGTIHSPETGAPTALMELAYRLAVDDAPYIQYIRSHVITLITPIVEVDGRDRMADLYAWHRAHPDDPWAPLMYWGHYVAHDNNRDAMAATLALTRNVMDTYLGWHAQVLHDLHESVPFLYDNTVGDGPYNAWLDPILTNEWQMLGWDNVQELTKFGLPGVFTHGDFDTWSPGYLMFIAATHNGVSRLYETFGNGGADTVTRILAPDEYSRTWYRQNPPLPKVLWSQRDNNNYEQNGLLTALHYFAENGKLFLTNFYLKSKRSVEKPANGGPAAYVLPADDPRPGAQAALLDVLQLQHCEIQRASAAFSVDLTPAPGPKDGAPKKVSRSFPAGSYIVRLDQPYSRIADALLDRQYWAPDDPQKNPYDDTAWSMGDLYGTEVVRVTDLSVLKAPMQPVSGPIRAAGFIQGSGGVYLIENHADNALISLRYALKGASMEVADAGFDAAGRHFPSGSLIVRTGHKDLEQALKDSGLTAYAVAQAPEAARHALKLPRIAIMHSWIDTQTEGWWRQALDKLGVPYSYISTQDASRETDLRGKYDVILFGPIGGTSTELIVDGLPQWGKAVPWNKKVLPNTLPIDETDDIRPGLGASGVLNLKRFVEQGGLLVTSQDTARFAIDEGLAPGVSLTPTHDLKVVGSVLKAYTVADAGPAAYGYGPNLAIYSADGASFQLSNQAFPYAGVASAGDYQRVTGRGGPDEEDVPQGRPYAAPPALPEVKPWEALPLNEDQTRNNPFVIPADYRPRPILRYAAAGELLVSGLLRGGQEMAERAAVVQSRLGQGHVLLFASDPIYRGETLGTYPLVFNAILNFDHLDAGSADSGAH